MDYEKILTEFINNGNFDSEHIYEFLESVKMSQKRLIKILFKKLCNNDLYDVKENIDHEYLFKLTELLYNLCESYTFDDDEIDVNKKRVKNARELILYYAKKHNDYKLLKIANELDEIVIDKNLNVKDVNTLIKELIDRKENVNIIKKIININKSAILSNNSELFGYVFDKAINAINTNVPDIYYYITLLKIVYSSRVDKSAFLKRLNFETPYDNEFSSEIYLILNGCKRGLDEEEILKKYCISTDCPEIITPSIFVPNVYDENLIFSIDNNATLLRDDAFSIQKDGPYTIFSIYISDVPSFVPAKHPVDIAALNNFKTAYLSDASRVSIYNKSVEDALSLDENKFKPVLAINVIIDDNMRIYDYYLTTEVIRVTNNLTYDQSNSLLDSPVNNELNTALRYLYDFTFFQESMHKKRRDYWEKKDEHPNGECINNKSDLIVRESMVLYNELMANIAYDSNIPFIYRTQAKEDISAMVEKQNIHVNDYVNNIIRNIYMQSLYSLTPGWHDGLDTHKYAQCSAPLRKYPCGFNQHLIHQYYLLDTPKIDYDFDLIVSYFNQRSEEISLFQSEYNRNYRLIRKK